MCLEAVIVQTWRTYSGRFRDTLGGHDQASLEMNMEATIVLVWRK